MTPLNTIIEEMVEEVMSFMENDFATGETSWTDTRTFFTKALTTAIQRAYEAGRDERDTYWKERVRKEIRGLESDLQGHQAYTAVERILKLLD